MKTKVLAGILTGAIFIWLGAAIFSKLVLLITLGFVASYILVDISWWICQVIKENIERRLRRKELKRRGFK